MGNEMGLPLTSRALVLAFGARAFLFRARLWGPWRGRLGPSRCGQVRRGRLAGGGSNDVPTPRAGLGVSRPVARVRGTREAGAPLCCLGAGAGLRGPGRALAGTGRLVLQRGLCRQTDLRQLFGSRRPETLGDSQVPPGHGESLPSGPWVSTGSPLLATSPLSGPLDGTGRSGPAAPRVRPRPGQPAIRGPGPFRPQAEVLASCGFDPGGPASGDSPFRSPWCGASLWTCSCLGSRTVGKDPATRNGVGIRGVFTGLPGVGPLKGHGTWGVGRATGQDPPSRPGEKTHHERLSPSHVAFELRPQSFPLQLPSPIPGQPRRAAPPSA